VKQVIGSNYTHLYDRHGFINSLVAMVTQPVWF